MERYYEAIDLLKGMISRPSFSRDETTVADFLQAEWQKAGQKVFRKGNNLWIIAPDFDFGKPTLLLRQARFRLDQRPVHSRRDRR